MTNATQSSPYTSVLFSFSLTALINLIHENVVLNFEQPSMETNLFLQQR